MPARAAPERPSSGADRGGCLVTATGGAGTASAAGAYVAEKYGARVGHPYGTVLDGRAERASEARAPSEVRGRQGTVCLTDIHRDFGDAGWTPP
ncbi:hypothetical protein OQI_05980 [Streptomyces pharetrae CZA14]|uniref:Uncharacterized protein n=1 Tax=Streptomyces pharetrae CZA14 TaxID=1144883 RepID=A0ABX3YNK0_9ACTN|nr:hypothetical protein OQI_05980 [Streptomyces pharetrae CZA14]